MKYLENGIEVEGVFYKLEDVIKNCNDLKIKKEDTIILKIEWSGRGGEVYEHLSLPKKTATKVKKLLLGKEVYFGEIWGKHSEVYGGIEEGDFKVITDKEKVQEFLTSYPNGSDYNHSFINTLIDNYSDNGGREYYEKEEGKKYCNDIEQLSLLIYNK